MLQAMLGVISIHVPTWGTTAARLSPGIYITSISIHVPTWGTTSSLFSHTLSLAFQSTFPRGERRYLLYSDPFPYTISIHVPTWGTTDSLVAKMRKMGISIHVPTWGTTVVFPSNCIRIFISIHVPTWGTTNYPGIPNANSRFQSTFPRGERLRSPFI